MSWASSGDTTQQARASHPPKHPQRSPVPPGPACDLPAHLAIAEVPHRPRQLSPRLGVQPAHCVTEGGGSQGQEPGRQHSAHCQPSPESTAEKGTATGPCFLRAEGTAQTHLPHRDARPQPPRTGALCSRVPRLPGLPQLGGHLTLTCALLWCCEQEATAKALGMPPCRPPSCAFHTSNE